MLAKFNYFIKKYGNETNIGRYCSVLDDLSLQIVAKYNVTVVRGGTVANFDNTKQSCPRSEIEITRALLYSAVLQAIEIVGSPDLEHSIALDSTSQYTIVRSWLKKNRRIAELYDNDMLLKFGDIAWIQENSK